MKPVIIHQTPEYFVINKPSGMATEPPSPMPTVRDWLIGQGYIKVGEWDEESRYGIVHRLDTDTSGVLIWAKQPAAQQTLKTLWQGRQVKKTYLALVVGTTEPSGTIELAIERDNQNDRQTVALLPSARSRPAITGYKTVGHSRIGEWAVSFVEATPITGRTHQIRVHFKAIGHPLVGDKLYGERASDEVAKLLELNRQFLHAYQLSLPSGETYQAELPSDLLTALRNVGFPSTITDTKGE